MVFELRVYAEPHIPTRGSSMQAKRRKRCVPGQQTAGGATGILCSGKGRARREGAKTMSQIKGKGVTQSFVFGEMTLPPRDVA